MHLGSVAQISMGLPNFIGQAANVQRKEFKFNAILNK